MLGEAAAAPRSTWRREAVTPLTAHNSFIELERDSCYCQTVNTDPLQAQARGTSRGGGHSDRATHTHVGWSTMAPATLAGLGWALAGGKMWQTRTSRQQALTLSKSNKLKQGLAELGPES